MRNFIICGVVFVLYAIPARWHYVCQIRNLCETSDLVAATAPTPENSERLTDLKSITADSATAQGFEHFAFLPNSAEPILSESNTAFLDNVADYMLANPTLRLAIKGFQFEEENIKTGVYDAVSIARAVAIRDWLVQKGINEGRFKIEGQVIPKTDSELIQRPIAYSWVNNAANAQNPTLAEASYTFNRMTFSDVNFENNTDVFTPTVNFDNYVETLLTFLKANPTKKITIVGHTDNSGTDSYSDGLGFSRARNVQVYLISKGIAPTSLEAVSEGKRKPIVPNDSNENLSKNRRIEVIIRD